MRLSYRKLCFQPGRRIGAVAVISPLQQFTDAVQIIQRIIVYFNFSNIVIFADDTHLCAQGFYQVFFKMFEMDVAVYARRFLFILLAVCGRRFFYRFAVFIQDNDPFI